MSNVIRPTVGREVYYWPNGNQHRLHDATPHGVIPTFQPTSAKVVKVWTDHMINVACLNENGIPFAVCSVELVQPGDEIPEGPHCSWMPYQVGQARAAKAIE